MSVRKFCLLVNEAKVGRNDRVWFPRWIRRYASMVEAAPGNLPVTEADVIRFLRTLRDNGTPASGLWCFSRCGVCNPTP